MPHYMKKGEGGGGNLLAQKLSHFCETLLVSFISLLMHAAGQRCCVKDADAKSCLFYRLIPTHTAAQANI